MAPRFIVFEGVTSTGKTTIAKMLVERLKVSGRRVFFNHEPTDVGVFGQIARQKVNGVKIPKLLLRKAVKTGVIPGVIKKLLKDKPITPLELQMLYMADRKLDLAETILKKISHGEWVVQDRYEVSTYAYGMMAGISFRQLKKTQDKILDGIYWKPDALFYFDLDPELSIKRLHASGKAIDEFETLAKVKKTRAAYKQILKNKELYHKLFVVDASRPIDEVFREICLRLGV